MLQDCPQPLFIKWLEISGKFLGESRRNPGYSGGTARIPQDLSPGGLTRNPPGLTRNPPGLTRNPPGLTRNPLGLTGTDQESSRTDYLINLKNIIYTNHKLNQELELFLEHSSTINH